MGVAVNVTEDPWHTEMADAEIETETGKSGLTVMDIEFEVAGFPVVHVSLDVTVHTTTSPFAGVYE